MNRAAKPNPEPTLHTHRTHGGGEVKPPTMQEQFASCTHASPSVLIDLITGTFQRTKFCWFCYLGADHQAVQP